MIRESKYFLAESGAPGGPPLGFFGWEEYGVKPYEQSS